EFDQKPATIIPHVAIPPATTRRTMTLPGSLQRWPAPGLIIIREMGVIMTKAAHAVRSREHARSDRMTAQTSAGQRGTCDRPENPVSCDAKHRSTGRRGNPACPIQALQSL